MEQESFDKFIFTTQLKEERDYWIKKLAREIGYSNLQLDHKRSKIYSRKKESIRVNLPDDTSQRLLALTGNSPLLIYATLLAALQICLYKHSGAESIAVGGPTPRQAGEAEGAGNILALVTDIDELLSFKDFLLRVRETIIEAYERQSYPFSRLINDLGLEELENKNPLFDILLILHGFHKSPPELKNDITLVFYQDNGKIYGDISYNAKLFNKESIEKFAQRYVQTICTGLENINRAIIELAILTAQEVHLYTVGWNATRTEYPAGLCAHQLFELQCEKTPKATALIFENEEITYEELNERAQRIAGSLQRLNVGPDIRVGICLERSPKMLEALLGVLKAGGAYVPLDPAYPKDRLAFILEDAHIAVLLTQQTLLAQIPEHTAAVICLDHGLQEPELPVAPATLPDNLAYVIYTSGSTGRPKGVAMTHRPLVNLLTWQCLHSALGEGARTLQLTSLNFDVSFQEIFATWCSGGTLVMASEVLRRDIASLPDFLVRQRVERVFLPFVVLQQLAEAFLSYGYHSVLLREVITAGEQLQITKPIMKLFRELDGCTLYNQYGPTETHVVTAFALTGFPTFWPELPPIGRPIANTQVYVLNRYLQPVPPGSTGELYIGGVAPARAYLDRPELTAEKFIPSPFSQEPGTRLYKTGDFVHYLPDGKIVFLNRLDDQVKIRGYRIEPGEIEMALRHAPGVREVVVVARAGTANIQRLIAYVVPEQGYTPTITEIQGFLKERLPAHMIPSFLVVLESLPLTPNGKVDRKNLPLPEKNRFGLEGHFVAPSTPTEDLLAGIWADVLGLEQVGIHDNFFELGGDSILGLQVIARANQKGLQIVHRQIMQYQTVAELASVVGTTNVVQAEQGLVTGSIPLTPIQHWFIEQNQPEPYHWNIAFLLELRSALAPALLGRVVQELLAHHDALRLRFVRRGSSWQQYNADVDALIPFTQTDLSLLPDTNQRIAIEKIATELQASLNLLEGPIVRVALFNSGQQKPHRLLIVIHHLAVDGVSWRILLEDLQTAYAQLSRGEAILLPAKTTSLKEWSHCLYDYAQSTTLKAELPYWSMGSETSIHHLPIDYPGGVNTETSSCTVPLILSVEETRSLLQEVPAVYGTQINDVLLTALVQAFTQWTGNASLLINLEGHGREEVLEGVDVSRTVGWFTSIFPVLLQGDSTGSPGDVLKSVKEQLRQIPNRGIGYGLLRYLSEDTTIRERLKSLPQAEVSFNYLGQYDQLLTEASLFRVTADAIPIGPMVSPHGTRSTILYIGGNVVQGQLHVDFQYSQNLHKQSTIESIAAAFAQALRSLISHCQSPDAGDYTPSDFPQARLSQQDFATVIARLRQVGG